MEELTNSEKRYLVVAVEALLALDWTTHVSNVINDSLLPDQADDMWVNLTNAVRKLKAR